MAFHRLGIVALSIGWLIGSDAGGASIALTPSADTTLFEHDPNNNLGAASLASGTTAQSRRSRALMRFDFAAIPANATITSVQLTVRVVKTPFGAASANFSLHRVSQAWGEGTQGFNRGQPAAAGEATWVNRFAPSTSWTTPGAASGSDYVAGASAGQFIGNFGSFTFSGAGLLTDVQSWISDPAQNFGWIMICASEGTLLTAKRFGSREDSFNAPSLLVEYTLPGPTRHSLTVAKSGTGSGTVTSDVPGINCGAACSSDFDLNSVVTLTATAAPGSVFSGWTGAGTGLGNNRSITMDGPKTVTALFQPANRPPVANSQSVTATEDTDLPITLSATDPDGDILAYAVTSSPPNGSLSGTAPNLVYRPNPDYNGSDNFTFSVNDGSGGSSAATVSISVAGVNDGPTLSQIANQTINANQVMGPIAFTVHDIETPTSQLQLTATASNTNLVASTNIVLGGTGTNRTVTVAPEPNLGGQSLIEIAVTDGSLVATQSFTLTVMPPECRVAVSPLAAQSVDEDGSAGPIPLVISANCNTNVNVIVSSQNETLLPNGNITVTGAGIDRRITLVPVTNRFGDSLVTITISDPEGRTAATVFPFTVNPINDPPSIAGLTDLNLTINQSSDELPFTVTDLETPSASLIVTGTASNTNLFPVGSIALGTATNRTLRLTPAPDQTGTANIIIIVADAEGARTTNTFVANVNCGASAPAVSPLSDVTTAEDTPVVGLFFSISDELVSASRLQVIATSSNTNLLRSGGVLLSGNDRNRTLNLVPEPNQSGTSTVTISVTRLDPCGPATTSRSFLFQVSPVNDPPVIAGLSNSVANACVPISIPFSVSDPETLAQDLALAISISDTSLFDETETRLTGTNSNWNIELFPTTPGVTTIMVTVQDADGLTMTNVFQVTVLPYNGPPAVGPIPNQTTAENQLSNPILFTVSPGTTNITVTSSNPALVTADRIVVFGTGTNRSLLITPEANQFGTALISVEAQERCVRSLATFLFTVTHVNRRPEAVDDAAETFEGVPIDIAVLANDFHPEGLDFRVVELSASTNGTAAINTNGTVRFAPAPNFLGTNQFSYTIADSISGTSTGKVSVTVHPRPVFITTRRETNSFFSATIQAAAGHQYVIEISTNLANWFPYRTNRPEQSTFEFTDPETLNVPHRFYRVVRP